MARAIYGAAESRFVSVSPFEKRIPSARPAGSLALRGLPVVHVRTYLPKQGMVGEATAPIEVGRTYRSVEPPKDKTPDEATVAELPEIEVTLEDLEEAEVVIEGARRLAAVS